VTDCHGFNMIKAIHEKMPKGTGGGYGRREDDGSITICVSPSEPPQRQRLIAIHEVLEMHLGHRICHNKLDTVAIDILDTLIQLGLL
jgi:hypothetical protein